MKSIELYNISITSRSIAVHFAIKLSILIDYLMELKIMKSYKGHILRLLLLCQKESNKIYTPRDLLLNSQNQVTFLYKRETLTNMGILEDNLVAHTKMSAGYYDLLFHQYTLYIVFCICLIWRSHWRCLNYKVYLHRKAVLLFSWFALQYKHFLTLNWFIQLAEPQKHK